MPVSVPYRGKLNPDQHILQTKLSTGRAGELQAVVWCHSNTVQNPGDSLRTVSERYLAPRGLYKLQPNIFACMQIQKATNPRQRSYATLTLPPTNDWFL